ncbi:ABC transporter substrate-binding protein [Streptomyces sp. NPDC055681]
MHRSWWRTVRRTLASAGMALCLGVTAACGGGASPDAGGTGASAPTGQPRSGGVLRMMLATEPRTLDPATIVNTQAFGSPVANALFGTLVHNDSTTGKLVYDMAESLESDDNGTTWTLTLKPGIKFSDGTPLNAEAVRYNWERTKDPKVGSPYATAAAAIKAFDVVDETTLKFALASPQANFPYSLVTNSFVWIASPASLKQGTAKFDENPIGAGPFVLKSWSRGGAIELVRNEHYYDAPKPYLDGITVTTVADPTQRVNSVLGGSADLVPASTVAARVKAAESGLQVIPQPINGGTAIQLNTTKAPFDNIRAREAVVKAIDVDVLNTALDQGKGDPIETLFTKGQTLYSDIKLRETDNKRAQELFDELAAEGKPVEFTITAANNPDLGEAVQTQLRGFKNVTVKVEKVETSESSTRSLNGNYQALTTGTPFVDPDSWASTWFYSKSPFYVGKPASAELDALITQARTISDPAERKAIWATFQKRIASEYAFIWGLRPELSSIASTKVGGIVSYGNGSVSAEGLWLAD